MAKALADSTERRQSKIIIDKVKDMENRIEKMENKGTAKRLR